MKLIKVAIRNFRRLEDVTIEFEEQNTVLVGPNNSGKTSATAAFKCFLEKRQFQVHDVSVSKVSHIDTFGQYGDAKVLPIIEMDLWFSIDPNHISFGRAFTLLPKLSSKLNSVGIRLKFQPRNPEAMLKAYSQAYPKQQNGQRIRTLSQFLGTDSNFKKNYEIAYFSLDETGSEPVESRLEAAAGKLQIKGMLRVDFVDAQRNIDDDEASRSNRLSTAFATFYKKNLEQADTEQSAYQVIDENNQKLTDHYAAHFSGLLDLIKRLGVPSINERDLKIISSLSPITALQGNTDLVYIDTTRKHELPESYNGLGYKNLIYMAIQISHFHLQWMREKQNRALCQLIFIEEPEVHLHAQVQQTFIANIWQFINHAAEAESQHDLVPQFGISTHSSHILDAVDFENVRYFERCQLHGEDRQSISTLNATKIHSLRDFQPRAKEVDDEPIDSEATKRFLLQYLKLTHCDLFFSDAAILVEGTVEKLLLPNMLEKVAPSLRTKYLTILEVGGAYAHRFEGLLEFLNIPHLIITDLDSVDPGRYHPACRGDSAGALTSNASLKEYFSVSTTEELLNLTSEEKTNAEKGRFIAFQTGVTVKDQGNSVKLIPRTIEEAFVFDNFTLFRKGDLNLGVDIPEDIEEAYQAIFERIKYSGFKKTEFALDVLASNTEWVTPGYIAEGLLWLEKRLAKINISQPLGGN